MDDTNQSMTDNATPFAPVVSRAPTPEELATIRRVWGAGDVYACDEKGAAAAYEDVPLLLGEIDRLTADRDAWRDALQHVACRLGGTGAGSPDDVRLACDDLVSQDDDCIAAGEDYQRERDELLALVREHFAAEAALCDVVERRAQWYASQLSNHHEAQELERELAATVLRTNEARAALLAKVTP